MFSCQQSGRTALHLAVQKGDYQFVKYLLKKGADIHVRDMVKILLYQLTFSPSRLILPRFYFLTPFSERT